MGLSIRAVFSARRVWRTNRRHGILREDIFILGRLPLEFGATDSKRER